MSNIKIFHSSCSFNITIIENWTLNDIVPIEEADFWAKLFDWRNRSKIFGSLHAFATIIFLCIPILNLLHQSRNRHIKTILNYMEMSALAMGTISLLQVLIIEEIRYFFGPLPYALCWYSIFLRNGPVIAVLLFLDAMAIFRYIYIFVWRAFAPIDDRFFAIFCNSIILIWSLLYGIVFMEMPGKKAINFYMCTGEDPQRDFYDHKKFPINVLLSVITVGVYVALSIKTSIRRWKLHKKDEVSKALLKLSEDDKKTSQIRKGLKSAVSYGGIVFYSTMVMAESIAWSFVTSKLSPDEIMSSNFATFSIYWHNNYGPSFHIWMFYFVNNSKYKNIFYSNNQS